MLPDGSSLQRPCRQSSVPTVPCLQQLRHSAPAGNIFPMALRCSAPASNKPHPAEKSTPVWLVIWRTWAGFANSQHRDAAFATPNNICAHSSLLQTLISCSDRRKSVGPSAPIAYATSVSPPDEAVAWPGCRYRMAMMLLPGRGAGVGCKMRLSLAQVRRSCKSPRARILVLGISGAHWPARWPRFELTEHRCES